MTLQPPVTPTNLGQLIDRLGRVPPERIRLKPFPGTATVADLRGAANRLCELVDGTLVEKANVGTRGSFLTGELQGFLRDFVRPHRLGLLGPPDFMAQMVSGNVLLPDISFYTWARIAADAPVAAGAPDLAVEVMSDSNTAAEMDRKRAEYFASGCRLVWEVEPELRLVRVYTDATTFATVTIEDILTGEPVLPGFSLPLRDLFDAMNPPGMESQP